MNTLSLPVPAATGARAAGWRRLADVLRRWHAADHARLTTRTLERLDDRTLRDLGFHRSEIPGLALELAGRIEPQHRRVRDAA